MGYLSRERGAAFKQRRNLTIFAPAFQTIFVSDAEGRLAQKSVSQSESVHVCPGSVKATRQRSSPAAASNLLTGSLTGSRLKRKVE